MLQEILRKAKQQLRDEGIDSWAIDAELLLCKIISQPREFLLSGEGELTTDQQFAFESLLRRRIAREPMSHLLGVREFWGRDFIVTRDTLDPRPDSETLIEAVLSYFQDKSQSLHMLDMGTGTGCLLLTLLSEYPYALGQGIDISDKALEVSQRNAEVFDLAGRVVWHHMDASGFQSKPIFDLVITNPPYIPTAEISGLEKEVSMYEPISALDGGKSGFDYYRSFSPVIASVLKVGGIAVIEAGQGQDEEIAHIMCEVGLIHLETKNDLAGIGRAVVVKKK